MKKIYQKTAALLCLCLLLCLGSVNATNYYVSVTGSDNNSGLNTGSAFATVAKAAGLTNPGDTVFVMNGTYAISALGNINSQFKITRSGSANGGYIVYKNYPGHQPKFKNPNAQWNMVYVKASYIIIDGIEVEGNRAAYTYEQAYACYQDYVAGRNPPLLGFMNCNGISLGRENANDSQQHHIIVRNCTIHDNTASGTGAGGCDYVTYENNKIYNNSWYTQWACSGISVINPYNSNGVTGYKIFVRNNICYNNKDLIPWVDLTPNRLSDGNGIIIDVNNGRPSGPNGPATDVYVGRTLVENNLCYNNGGSGIHAYSANHVDIINNTAYHNGTVVNYGNIYAGDATDCNITNNIMYARDGGRCNTTPASGTTVNYDYNIYFNGSVEARGPHDIVADPKFVSRSIDPLVANFQLQGGSPGINSGSNTPGFFSPNDINYVGRPISSRPEVGAYEFQSGITAQTITFPPLPAMAVGAADYTPQATATSGLPATYRSSNIAVATIINNKIQIVNGGTATITATQGGDAVYGPAADVSQTLTITGGGTTNLITNGTFDVNTAGWNSFVEAPAAFTYTSSPQAGYSSNVAKLVITAIKTPAQSYQLQMSQPLPLEAGRTYSIKFKGSASANRTMDIYLQSNTGSKPIIKGFYNIALTTQPTNYSYIFTSNVTDNTNIFKFLVGNNMNTVYLDDVEVTIVPSAEINVKQGTTNIADNTGSFSFGNVDAGASSELEFTIENLGDRTLNLLSSVKAIVSNAPFSVTSDSSLAVNAGASTTFKVKFSPTINGNISATITIPNDDLDENPYNFTISGIGVNGPVADQTITFAALSKRNLTAPDFNPGATASSGLPVTYTSSNPVVATIVNGLVHVTGVLGSTNIVASQVGDANFHPAVSVTRALTVDANMIGNAYFDSNTTGWGTYANPGTAIKLTSVPQNGYTGNVLKAELTNGGTTNWYLQANYYVNLAQNSTYVITFKASADNPGNAYLAFQKNGVTLSSGIPATPLTTTPTAFGPYTFTSATTVDSAQLKFYLGQLTGNVYIDDVEMYMVSTLPLNLVSFSANAVNGTASLKWNTVNEEKVREIMIEKRAETATNFLVIASLPAKNTASAAYSYIDSNISGRQNYYRLKIVDLDGSLKYSGIRMVEFAKFSDRGLSIYPNPVQNIATVAHEASAANAIISIYSIDGRLISSQPAVKNATKTAIQTAHLVSGQYNLVYRNGEQTKSVILIKK